MGHKSLEVFSNMGEQFLVWMMADAAVVERHFVT